MTLGVQVIASASLFAQVLLINQALRVALHVADAGQSLGRVVTPVVLLGLLTAVTTLAFSIVNLQRRVLQDLVARSVWRRVLDVSQAVELSAYDDPGFHDQAERVQASAASRTQIVIQALVVFIGDALGILAGTAAVLTVAPLLAPLLLLSAVPLVLTSRISGRLEFAFSVEQSVGNRERSYIQSLLTGRDGAKEVRAFSMFGTLRKQWEYNYSLYLDGLRRHVQRRVRLTVIGNLAAATLTVGAMLLALLLVAQGYLAIASAGAALVAVRLLGGLVAGAGLGLSTMFESTLFLRDLGEFLGRMPPQAERSGLTAPASFDRMTASGVSFTYPGASRAALTDVSVDARRGEIIAIVGENGSGKSTLVKLLADLYEPDQGSVCWDGVDLRSYERDSVRRRIAVIFQDFIRYHLTARSNIALGRPDGDVDEAAVRAAARDAGADSLIRALPAGYDTVLSSEYEGGTDLSLGQWQRIALARAFIRNAPFIIFDEPSASLDARAEYEFFRRIRTLFSGKTVVLISHRFSTVRMADRIYVMSGGSIVEEGDHVSLMSQEGVYAELFTMQARGYS